MFHPSSLKGLLMCPKGQDNESSMGSKLGLLIWFYGDSSHNFWKWLIWHIISCCLCQSSSSLFLLCVGSSGIWLSFSFFCFLFYEKFITFILLFSRRQKKYILSLLVSMHEHDMIFSNKGLKSLNQSIFSPTKD